MLSVRRLAPVAGRALACGALVGSALLACSGGGGTTTGAGGTPGAGGAEASSSSSTAPTTSGGGQAVATSSSSGVVATGGSGSTSTSTGVSACAEAAGYAPSGFSCSGKKPSLANDVGPITAANCSAQPCHSAMDTGEGMRQQLLNIPCEECDDARLMVNPGNPECSYVIHKLTGKNLGTCSPMTSMPLGKAMLDAADVQTVYDWICEGAPDN